ncbi:hypothetical protein [Clostridium butyricum]|nr:hypothetical protein [Clostridium butyricum]
MILQQKINIGNSQYLDLNKLQIGRTKSKGKFLWLNNIQQKKIKN